MTRFGRRGLLAVGAAGGLGLAGCGGSGGQSSTPSSTPPTTAAVEKNSAAPALAAETDVQDEPFAVPELASGDPGYLVRDAGDIVLLSAVCSHAGCFVEWRGDRDAFVCPCHRGTYDVTGEVIEGPPPRALERLPVELRDGEIYEVAP